jgi:hypothetical protein
MLSIHGHPQSFIDQIFLGCHDISDITKGSGIKRFRIDMHMDTAASIRQCPMLFQLPDDLLNRHNILIATDGTYHLRLIFSPCIDLSPIRFFLRCYTPITHKLPLPPLRVNGCIGIVIGSQIFDSSSKILCRYLSRFRTGNAGHLNLNAKFLLL